ncbi:MAG TPA: DUF6644 family protein [Burkholderiales bacterium]|nr:DUF6644 family protein [Burkholderiales bacterium]
MAPGGAVLEAIEGGRLAAAMRDSLWLYPAVETLHILGFCVLVGAVMLFDLRVLGAGKRMPIRMLARQLLPWSLAALLLIVPTGLLMFASAASDLVANRAFVVKMLLLMLAGTNAAAFHLGAFRTVARWDRDVAAPAAAKLHALASMAIWAAVVACGRLIAYV